MDHGGRAAELRAYMNNFPHRDCLWQACEGPRRRLGLGISTCVSIDCVSSKPDEPDTWGWSRYDSDLLLCVQSWETRNRKQET